nr:hypothetical protein [uncultured archaeon]
MSGVLFIYPNALEIPVHPEFDKYERLMMDFAEERDLVGLAWGSLGYYGATYGYVITVRFPKRKWHLYKFS